MSDPSSARFVCRVLVKAPKILGTWCMESDTLYVSPEGSDENKGSDASRPLATIQHAVNLAANSGTTIRLGPGTFRGNELLPTGWKIPVELADHIVEPVGLRGDYLSLIGGYDRGSAYFYFRISAAGSYSVWIRVGFCSGEAWITSSGNHATKEDSWFIRKSDKSLEKINIGDTSLSATFGWKKFESVFAFSHPAVHVVELRGREPNCRISHVYFGTDNPVDADVYAEDPALTQIRLGCRSIVSPLLRRCNFNVETGSKQISIVGVSPQETAIDAVEHTSGLPPGRSNPSQGVTFNGGSSLNNVSMGYCMAAGYQSGGKILLGRLCHPW